jgi:hypothetical protein
LKLERELEGVEAEDFETVVFITPLISKTFLAVCFVFTRFYGLHHLASETIFIGSQSAQ